MYIIDRFEGDTAVIEHDGDFLQIPRAALPAEAGEGAVLKQTALGWQRDAQAEAARRAAMAARRKRRLKGE